MLFRIREAREQCGLTQAAMADMLGINGVTLSGYETGKHDPKSDTLVKIAQICNVSVDFLLGREEQSKKEVSDRALEIARAYEMMSDYGRAIVDFIVEQEEKRKRESFGKPKILSSGYKAVPMIQTKDDAELFMEYTAKRELMELSEEESPTAIKPDA